MYRAVLTTSCLSFLPGLALFYTGDGLAFSPNHGRVEHVLNRAMLPLRLARLALKPPDRVLLMPVRGASVKTVKKSWHARRANGRRKHEGEDIYAPRGTPIYSATNGVVLRITFQRVGGKSLFIAGAGNRTYYYTHLDRYAEISVGDVVTPETIIGYVGNTGNARTTPSHLHFGIYSPRGAIDPLPLLADRQWEKTSRAGPVKRRALTYDGM